MDLAAVFALSLLGGYYFSIIWRLTAFSTRRVEGQHLYFRAALYGAILFLAALGLRNWVLVHLPGYLDFDAGLINYVKPALKEETGITAPAEARRAEWLVTAAYSMLIGPVGAVLLNVVTPRRWALRRSLDALDKLLLDAQNLEMPVQLTLNNQKVYIGLALSNANPDPKPDVIKILPMFSGYRDPRGRMVLTSNYEAVYTKLEAGEAAVLGLSADWLAQFELSIRADTIVSPAMFSPAIYASFNPDWEQQIAQQGNKPPAQELTVEIRRSARTGAAESAGGTEGAADL